MEETKFDKTQRILGIYSKLANGYIVNKAEEAVNYGVNERSIQRDIDDIRNFIDSDPSMQGMMNAVIYDRSARGYRLETQYRMRLTNNEIFAVCKILLESRAFSKSVMQEILEKLIECCVPQKNQKLVEDLIKNEEFHYVEPQHKSDFLNTLWDLGIAIRNYSYIEISYKRTKDKRVVTRRLKPVGIMFSEFYFYLTAFIDDPKTQENFDVINDSFPTIYRLDRIHDLKILDDHFHIPYSSKFEEGEFRKRIQFMYGGKVQWIRFENLGVDVDAILDRLPTAIIESENNGVYVIRAEVFGKGIDMWLRSQGENVRVLRNE